MVGSNSPRCEERIEDAKQVRSFKYVGHVLTAGGKCGIAI